jgi:hypothetical protein
VGKPTRHHFHKARGVRTQQSREGDRWGPVEGTMWIAPVLWIVPKRQVPRLVEKTHWNEGDITTESPSLGGFLVMEIS